MVFCVDHMCTCSMWKEAKFVFIILCIYCFLFLRTPQKSSIYVYQLYFGLLYSFCIHFNGLCPCIILESQFMHVANEYIQGAFQGLIIALSNFILLPVSEFNSWILAIWSVTISCNFKSIQPEVYTIGKYTVLVTLMICLVCLCKCILTCNHVHIWWSQS